MSWARNFRRTMVAGLGAGAVMFAVPASSGVVVKSSGPSAEKYPRGKKLKDNSRITLQAGDSVTILSKGGTKVLKGAGTYRVGARGTKARTRYDNLVRARSASRVRIGAARSGSGEALSPNIWYVDVTKSGTICVTDMADVTLWRPDNKKDQTFIVGPATSDYHYHVEFKEKVSTRPVDAEKLALKAATDYTITGQGEAATATVNFTVVTDAPSTAEEMAAMLIEKGCTTQLELLAASTAVESL